MNWEMSPRGTRDGFVLVLTLLILGLVSAGVVAVMLTGRTGASEASALETEARHRAILEAATVRAAYSFRVADDAFEAFRASEKNPAIWRFDGIEVELFGQPESAKIDLNAGNGELIDAMLRVADLGDIARTSVSDAIEAARSERRVLPSVRSVLEPCRRMNQEAVELERRFTVMTGLRGVTPGRAGGDLIEFIPGISEAEKQLIADALAAGRPPADDRRLTRILPYLSDGSSVYSFVARLRSSVGGKLGERRAILMLQPRAPRMRLVGVEWGRPRLAGSC